MYVDVYVQALGTQRRKRMTIITTITINATTTLSLTTITAATAFKGKQWRAKRERVRQIVKIYALLA